MTTNIANSNTNRVTSSAADKPVETKTLASSKTTAQSKKPRWKWSGDDEPSEFSRWDDKEDKKGYDAYEVDSGDHAFLNEEEEEESDKHQFGLCWSCKKGLDDRADFVCDDRDNGKFFFMCTDCYEGYSQPWYHHGEKQGADP
jgi:hypothetical protein